MKANVLLISLLLLATNCKKDTKAPDTGTKVVPEKVKHGTPQGAAIQKTIGPEGGSITSGDGYLSIQVPAGTVDAATVFSVQPIENTLGLGKGPSYRLQPENIDFKKDLEVTINYSTIDLAGSVEDMLHLAYQDREGYWHRALDTEIDKTQHVLNVKTRHFSDWTVSSPIQLVNNGNTDLAAGQQTTFTIYAQYTASTELTIDDLLGPVDQKMEPEHIQGWEVHGPGGIAGGQNPDATYKAPASLTEPATAEVAVTLKNIVEKINPKKSVKFGTMIILSPVNLVGDEYFNWTIKGQSVVGISKTAMTMDGKMVLASEGPDGGLGFIINAMGTGTYSFGDTNKSRNAGLTAWIATDAFSHYYYHCDDHKEVFGDGSVTITRFDQVGGYVEGKFSGTVYSNNNCFGKSAKVVGTFRSRRYQ